MGRERRRSSSAVGRRVWQLVNNGCRWLRLSRFFIFYYHVFFNVIGNLEILANGVGRFGFRFFLKVCLIGLTGR